MNGLKHTLFFVGILVAFVAWSSPQQAPRAEDTATPAITGALMTGKSLLSLCTSGQNADQFACQSYIAGIIDYHRLVRSLGTAPTVDFCIPENVKMADMRDKNVAYLLQHSEHHDFIAAPGVSLGLYKAFPCSKRRR
jgi:hypothetical protein